MDLSKLKIKNTNKCNCGHAFTIDDRTENMQKNSDYHFYGGRAEYFTSVKCPECSKEYIAMIESINNGYRVFDISDKNENVIPIEDDNTEKEETDNVIEDLICDKCGRSFKNKSGLSSHKKKCL